MTLIRYDGAEARIAADEWQSVGDADPIPERGDVIVSFERFLKERDRLRAREGRVGVRLSAEADPDAIAGELEGVALAAVEFPKFSDGRGFSIARVLKARGGFSGELRAVGNVLRDQLFFMWRCGFTSFELDPAKDPQEALTAFADFSVTYQPAGDHDVPIWRRRRTA
jgi:uncharacterized protein (DUF934 family)